MDMLEGYNLFELQNFVSARSIKIINTHPNRWHLNSSNQMGHAQKYQVCALLIRCYSVTNSRIFFFANYFPPLNQRLVINILNLVFFFYPKYGIMKLTTFTHGLTNLADLVDLRDT